ncbi:carboxymuconolactone decarboxylase family protein [Paramicrobacterium sp. CJ85]|uniref:carboxymuconolactone decarboxylase family protein n=1 Tax=Paramicrobacterium sp. CJ85 TaxID=3445355 RepID=UPI003F600B45
MSTDPRLDIHATDPNAYKPLFALEKYIHDGSLGEDLLALIKLRASQMNGCAYCLNMHAGEARKARVDQRKLDVLAGWREADYLYSDRELAALALTEEVTDISDGVSDDAWDDAAEEFDDQELVELLMAISAINVWNRLAIATHQHLD